MAEVLSQSEIDNLLSGITSGGGNENADAQELDQEIVDYDFTDAVPILMQPGDLLIFHSFLMHSSVDNQSNKRRAAAMFHFAQAGTQKTQDIPIYTFDFMPVRRSS